MVEIVVLYRNVTLSQNRDGFEDFVSEGVLSVVRDGRSNLELVRRIAREGFSDREGSWVAPGAILRVSVETPFTTES